MEVTDQALLARYLDGGGGDENDAFRQLLDRHSGLVYGVAVRATGDPGAAEEVAQDVFLLLARKARALASHPSLAGWLHLTSRNLARHAQRRHRTRDRHLSHLKNETRALHPPGAPAEAGHPLGEKVDASVQRLPSGDREAILLRFYEDREYRDIARHLAISEQSARKRVSRALKRLQKSIGPEFAGATTLASLAVMPPPGVAEAIASTLSTTTAATVTAASTTATTTGILAIMTKQTTITLVSAVVLGGGALLYEVDQQAEKKRLLAKLERLEESQLAAAAAEKPAATRAPSASRESTAKRIADLEAELETERAKTAAAEKRAQELEAVAAQLDDQVVVAYGKVEEIGGDFGNIFAEALALSELEKKGELDTPENQARYFKFIESAASLGGLSQEIIKFDGNPEEGSRFFAATYAEVFGLDQASTGQMQSVLAGHFRVASERGLTLSDLPKEKLMQNPQNPPQEVKDWLASRQAYYAKIRNDLRNLVPLQKQSQFDQWVEKGGIGFNNIKLKEHNLAFSLGGDQ